ncbi:WAS/WASL-interacting protein family member 3-like [Sarcophilus harrisii]|uniref:WAS/WASL-interacting protein family member 3-like n=1 Tax=Sarcophilus harrisii TaxID=9305 RepID=UPI001301AB72|nr:WAS/WASL-interacting protein family member 3-like [Sarcophilus harrisii]
MSPTPWSSAQPRPPRPCPVPSQDVRSLPPFLAHPGPAPAPVLQCPGPAPAPASSAHPQTLNGSSSAQRRPCHLPPAPVPSPGPASRPLPPGPSPGPDPGLPVPSGGFVLSMGECVLKSSGLSPPPGALSCEGDNQGSTRLPLCLWGEESAGQRSADP